MGVQKVVVRCEDAEENGGKLGKIFKKVPKDMLHTLLLLAIKNTSKLLCFFVNMHHNKVLLLSLIFKMTSKRISLGGLQSLVFKACSKTSSKLSKKEKKSNIKYRRFCRGTGQKS